MKCSCYPSVVTIAWNITGSLYFLEVSLTASITAQYFIFLIKYFMYQRKSTIFICQGISEITINKITLFKFLNCFFGSLILEFTSKISSTWHNNLPLNLTHIIRSIYGLYNCLRKYLRCKALNENILVVKRGYSCPQTKVLARKNTK